MDIKDPRAQKTLLIGIAMAGIAYLYFFATFVPFGYRAMMAEKKNLKEKYEEISTDLNKARQTLASMPRVEKEFDSIQKRYQAARVLLPEEKEVANLLRMVSLVGQQDGVTFALFRPLATVPQGYYIENPVDVKVSGGYHEVGSFLADVANLSRIVKVSNLALSSYKQGKPDETVEASFTASAYTLNPNPEPQNSPDAKSDGKVGAKDKKNAKDQPPAAGKDKPSSKRLKNGGTNESNG